MSLFTYLTENITSFSITCIFLHVVTNLGISKIMKILSCVEQDKNEKYNLCYYKFNELETKIEELEEKVATLTEHNRDSQLTKAEFVNTVRDMFRLNNSNDQTSGESEIETPFLEQDNTESEMLSPCLESPCLESPCLNEDNCLKQELQEDYEHVTDKQTPQNVSGYSYWSVFTK